MIRSVFLRRTLALVLATLFLSTVLTAAGFFLFAQQVFARMRASELAPTAQVVAELVVSARNGSIPFGTLVRLVAEGPDFWGAEIVVFDEKGAESLGLYPDSVPANRQLLERLAPRVKRVLAGQPIVEIQSIHPLPGGLLVVGTPIVDDGSTIGAVLLLKPMMELRSAMTGLNRTLFLSMCAAFLLMLLPSYFAARRLILPVRKMQSVADAMTGGNYTVQADETPKGELGALAVSLNRLSGELARTIGELKGERNELAFILDGLTEGIVAMDAAGCVTRSNPAMERLAGSGGTAVDPVDRIPGLRDDLRSTLRDGRPRVREFPAGLLTLRVSVSPLRGEEGSLVGAVALVRDMTESARLERARREYVSNVSHEFRTPVSSIRGLLEPLRDGLVTGEEDRIRYYSFMLRETERLTRLIDDLLELSRLQSGTAAFEGRPFSLPRLFEEVRERFQRPLAEKRLHLQVDIPSGDPPAAYGSPDRAEQVLVALVDNAVKFTPDGGKVWLRADLEENRFRISVRDDGPGIPADALPEVFERFFKAEGGRSGEGSGLGLSIAREVLRGMGQEIEAKSEPGKGATFTFTLDRADRRGASQPEVGS